jgi:hypothetical protein
VQPLRSPATERPSTGAHFQQTATRQREQNISTGKRINSPLPDCAVRKSDCQDISILVTVDGFSTDPRIFLPYTRSIDVSTATSETIFLINFGDVTTGRDVGQRVHINQRSWDPNTITLIFNADNFPAEHASYALIVTRSLLDTVGHPVQAFPPCDITEIRDGVR